MARLTAEQKIFIVQRLARFDTPSQVAKAIKEELGVSVSPQAAEAYDPTKAIGAGLSARLRDVFEATRKQFLEDTSEIAISHKAVRLRTLQRMAVKAEERGNFPLAAQLLEQAAKEVGGSYTNRQLHELTGKDGKPLAVETRTEKMTDGELDARILELTSKVVASPP